MRILITFLFLFACTISSAQFGIRIKQNLNDYPSWDQTVSSYNNRTVNILSQGREVGIDYWFRLKNARVEFFPEISFTQARTTTQDELFSEYNLKTFGVNFNTQIYILDFLGDCDCPTFSKQGNGFTKGLFIILSPGLVNFQQKLVFDDFTTLEPVLHSSINYKLAAGIGLDIGISDLFTISPYVMYSYIPNIRWDEFESSHFRTDRMDGISNGKTVQIGVRFGIRADYKN